MGTQLELPLFPLNIVLFPKAILPLRIFEERYKLMMGRVLGGSRQFGVTLIKSGVEVGGPATPFDIGTTAVVKDVAPMGGGRLAMTCVGERPFRILEILHEEPYMVAVVETLEYDSAPLIGNEDLIDQVKSSFRMHVKLISQILRHEPPSISLDLDTESLSYLVGSTMQVHAVDKQELLEISSVETRLRKEADLLERENVVLKHYITRRDRGDDDPPDKSPYSPNFSRN